MILADMRLVNGRDFTAHLASTPSWRQQVAELTPIKLKSIHELVKIGSDKRTADRAVTAILQSVKRAEFFGEIDPPLDLTFDFHGPLLIQDFNRHLESLSDPLKRVFIVGLALDIPLTDVVTLNWTFAKQILRKPDTPDEARKIFQSQIRNVKTDYVFWQYGKGFEPKPAYEADQIIQNAIDCKWSEYRRRFKAMSNKPF